jgi:histidine triad (HIT) family protein
MTCDRSNVTLVNLPDCPFCQISLGQAAASVVVREPLAMAFLDARPLFKGHALVAPREHLVDLKALPPTAQVAVFDLARRVAIALEPALGAGGALLALNNKVSQSVAHLHIHVVPRQRGDGLRGFFWPRQRYDSEAERDELAARIGRAVGAIS